MNWFFQSVTRRSTATILGVATIGLVCWQQANGQPNFREIQKLTTRINQQPTDVPAIAARAGHWANAGAVALALQDYDLVVSLAPTVSEYRSSRAIVHLNDNNLPMATNDCGVALKLDNRNATAYRVLAQIQLAQQNPAQAMDTLNRALTIKTDDALLWRLRAQANGATGNFAAAIANLEAAVAYEPANAEAWNDLGHFRRMHNDLHSALKAYENAYSIDPSILQTSLGLGRVHLALGNSVSAKTALDRVSAMRVPAKPALNSEYSEVSRLLGDAAVAKPNWTEAITHYRASLKSQRTQAVEDKLATVHIRQLSDLILKLGDSQGAISLHQTAINELPVHKGMLSQEFAKIWLQWANPDAATTEPQFVVAKERLITSLKYQQDTKVQHKLVETLVRMMEFYAPLPNRKKEAGLVYADALRYSTGDRTLTDWVIAKWSALNL